MNKENIQKGIDYLEANYDDISKRFDMWHYRVDPNDYLPTCKSVGCLVGHLTALDVGNINQNYKSDYSSLNFQNWSEDFFDVYDEDWCFLFGGAWSTDSETNTLQQGINRMKYMLEHERHPKDWKWGDTYE